MDVMQEQLTEARATIRACILATDMSRHKDILQDLESAVSLPDNDLALKLILKCADLSNCSRPAAANDRWVGKLLKEFVCQGREEREKGFNPSPGMGPDDNVPKGQVFFYSVVCKPLFERLVSFIPEAAPVLEGLNRNICRWQGMVDVEEACAAKINYATGGTLAEKWAVEESTRPVFATRQD
jgi:hypothetical protein